jgi:thiol-disulfide isomerase/thioredoxin
VELQPGQAEARNEHEKRAMSMKRSFLIVLALLVVAAIAVVLPRTMRHARAAVWPGAATHSVSASQSNAHPAPIRFVKDPESAPAFEMRDISGNMVSTASWSGKVVLLAFWATWCPPCRAEIPALIDLQTRYKDKLQIVSISEDDDPPEKILKFVQQKGINYPVVMATPALIDKYGGVPALPTTFVIDTHGRVVQKHMGLRSNDDYEREIKALLGAPVDAPVETFVDTGQVFLKNAANATELPGVNLAGLTPEQKKGVLHRLNAENCTCGCTLTLSECRINDTSCPVSLDIAAKVVSDVVKGVKTKGVEGQPAVAKPQTSPKGTPTAVLNR